MKKNFLMMMAALAFVACGNAPETTVVTEAAEGPSFQEVLTSRRSIRAYDATKTISKDEVRTLMTAVQEAPSWANAQPSRYYVAMSAEKIDAVKEVIGPNNKKNVEGAPVLIVSTFEKGKSGFFGEKQVNEIGDGWGCYDNGLSNGYLVLQARAMGFDTLIMGMRESDKLREIFGIPQSETVMAVISLGYRAADPTRPGRKELSEMVKFF